MSEGIRTLGGEVIFWRFCVFIPSFRKEAKVFFEIPRPLCLKGLHLSLYSLSSGEGKVDSDGNPLRQSFGMALEPLPFGFAIVV